MLHFSLPKQHSGQSLPLLKNRRCRSALHLWCRVSGYQFFSTNVSEVPRYHKGCTLLTGDGVGCLYSIGRSGWVIESKIISTQCIMTFVGPSERHVAKTLRRSFNFVRVGESSLLRLCLLNFYISSVMLFKFCCSTYQVWSSHDENFQGCFGCKNGQWR